MLLTGYELAVLHCSRCGISQWLYTDGEGRCTIDSSCWIFWCWLSVIATPEVIHNESLHNSYTLETNSVSTAEPYISRCWYVYWISVNWWANLKSQSNSKFSNLLLLNLKSHNPMTKIAIIYLNTKSQYPTSKSQSPITSNSCAPEPTGLF